MEIKRKLRTKLEVNYVWLLLLSRGTFVVEAIDGNTHEMTQQGFLKDCLKDQLLNSFVPLSDNIDIQSMSINNRDLYATESWLWLMSQE